MRPYHVAIVGSGPSGFFAAASLLKAADADDNLDVAVDMLEMLPTPWGLVRSGVAPDHPKIKSISKQFENIADDLRFRFFGNIVIGEHLSATELSQQYDAVIYAIGAQADRPLNIPGEHLPGSVAAVVRPRTEKPWRMIAPAPRKPMPVTICAAMRVGSARTTLPPWTRNSWNP